MVNVSSFYFFILKQEIFFKKQCWLWYIKTKKEHEIITVIKNEHKNNFEKTNSNCENPNSFNFNIEDDLLINLINNAKQKAHELIEETKNDFITLTKAFLKGFIERKF